jgi:hypothetical protein
MLWKYTMHVHWNHNVMQKSPKSQGHGSVLGTKPFISMGSQSQFQNI